MVLLDQGRGRAGGPHAPSGPQDELDDFNEMRKMVLESMSNQIRMKRKNLLNSLVAVSGWRPHSALLSSPSSASGSRAPPASALHRCREEARGAASPSFTENPAAQAGGPAAEVLGKPGHGGMHRQVPRSEWARTVVVPLRAQPGRGVPRTCGRQACPDLVLRRCWPFSGPVPLLSLASHLRRICGGPGLAS